MPKPPKKTLHFSPPQTTSEQQIKSENLRLQEEIRALKEQVTGLMYDGEGKRTRKRRRRFSKTKIEIALAHSRKKRQPLFRVSVFDFPDKTLCPSSKPPSSRSTKKEANNLIKLNSFYVSAHISVTLGRI